MEAMAWIGGVLSIVLALARVFDHWKYRSRLRVTAYLTEDPPVEVAQVLGSGDHLFKSLAIRVVNAGLRAKTIRSIAVTQRDGPALAHGDFDCEQWPVTLAFGEERTFRHYLALPVRPVSVSVTDSLDNTFRVSKKGMQSLCSQAQREERETSRL